MLERADMLLPAMPISQWPSPCSISTQSPQGLGAMDAFGGGGGSQWEHRDEKLERPKITSIS